jgi:Uri superfamily endonuclease
MDKGIYSLIFETPGRTISVGALGNLMFQPGWYIYIGSALGSGGLKRLWRHISLAHLQDKRPKWHVDYLLIHPDFYLRYAIYAVTGKRFECILARSFFEPGVPAFGSSDCTCSSHLFYRPSDPKQEILTAFRKLQLAPVIKTIINPKV